MKWPDDFINKVIRGDCLEVMKEMLDKSVDMVITSPPYWGLRDYGTGPDQLGLEPTPELYIKHLTEIFNEAKRVLKKEGTFWLNMGDSYMGSNQGYGQHGPPTTGFQDVKKGYYAAGEFKRTPLSFKHSVLKAKCLCMIPERLAWLLIKDGWILRNKIIWYKPNAMPSSVTDRFSNRWEYLFMFSKSQRYYFDLDAVREPHLANCGWMKSGRGNGNNTAMRGDGQMFHPAGKNPGDVFEINTHPFPEAHFAVFPEDLCEKPIKAGCPKQVCKKCGKARERIIEKEVEFTSGSGKAGNPPKGKHEHSVQSKSGSYDIRMGPQISTKTIGWTSCKCKADFKPGIVLDPFAGAGTVGVVAKSLGRKFILIDIKKEYIDMAKKRVVQVGYQKELFEE